MIFFWGGKGLNLPPPLDPPLTEQCEKNEKSDYLQASLFQFCGYYVAWI